MTISDQQWGIFMDHMASIENNIGIIAETLVEIDKKFGSIELQIIQSITRLGRLTTEISKLGQKIR